MTLPPPGGFVIEMSERGYKRGRIQPDRVRMTNEVIERPEWWTYIDLEWCSAREHWKTYGARVLGFRSDRSSWRDNILSGSVRRSHDIAKGHRWLDTNNREICVMRTSITERVSEYTTGERCDIEEIMHRSAQGRWKRINNDTSLTAYPTVCCVWTGKRA